MVAVERVHLLFKTHLDVGFTDLAAAVKHQYFSDFFPRAMALSEEVRRIQPALHFIWTTGSWILTEYLEASDAADRQRIETAIAQGDLAYHGLPFTTHTELMDPTLFRYGISLAQALDGRFGKHTISAKMTDVPGHTRAMIPLLAEAGIAFLHIGVNPGATPPDVPPAFRWRDPSGAEVIVVYERGTYGSLRLIPDVPVALMFQHTLDNIGPPRTAGEVVAAAQQMQAQFPHAEVRISTLDDFARDLLPYRDRLPIITGEIGDTWIHGVGSDPLKVSQFRELSRLRDTWQDQGTFKTTDSRWRSFHRALLMIPEHTWGLDEKKHLGDTTHYTPAQLAQVRDTPPFVHFAASWAEQRAYITEAVAALGVTPEAREATDHLAALQQGHPSVEGWTVVAPFTAPIQTAHVEVAFNQYGDVIQWRDQRTGSVWADTEHPLGGLSYQSFGADDYARFLAQYIIQPEETMVWAREDYGKPGLDAHVATGTTWRPDLVGVWHQASDDGDRISLALAMPSIAVERGAPRTWSVLLYIPSDASRCDVTVAWSQKRASRLPEALWWHHVPCPAPGMQWRIEKLGEWIDPLEVIPGGNQHLHATQGRVDYRGDPETLRLTTLDAPLVAPGQMALLHFDRTPPDLTGGMHINLYNNIWGTNFPMWYDDDARFRFVLEWLASR